MSFSIKVDGVWKEISSANINVSGTWKTVSEVYIKQNGEWKLVDFVNSIYYSFYPRKIDYSCRFNRLDSPSLLRTPTVTTNKTNWTFSIWLKRCSITQTETCFFSTNSTTANTYFSFDTSDKLNIQISNGSSVILSKTNRVFRDTSSWYHIVVSVDTTNVVPSERVRLYVNGWRENDFSTLNYVSQNFQTNVSTDSVGEYIGRHYVTNLFYDGYISDVVFVDGLTLDASHFGQYSPNNEKVWVPKTIGSTTNQQMIINRSSGTTVTYTEYNPGGGGFTQSSALFDGNYAQNSGASGNNNDNTVVEYWIRVGKDWGNGITKSITKAILTSASDVFINASYPGTARYMKLQGSNDGSTWVDLSYEKTFTSTSGYNYIIESEIFDTTPYRYHGIYVFNNQRTYFYIAEVSFFENETSETYKSTYSIGNRTSIITSTASNSSWWRVNSSPSTNASYLVDGSTANVCSFGSTSVTSGEFLQFNLSVAKKITGFRWIQTTAASHGIWKFQGQENINSSWEDIGSTFTLGGATSIEYSFETQKEYLNYRITNVSGTSSNTPYINEIEFKVYDELSKQQLLGTNGFHLDFSNSGALGTDISGNSNNFTPSNLASNDQFIDTPTRNFVILNSNDTSGGSVKDGGQIYGCTGGTGTIGVSKANIVPDVKCYWECLVPTTKTWTNFGLMKINQNPLASGYAGLGTTYYPDSISYRCGTGSVYKNDAILFSGTAPAVGNIIGFAYDPETGKVWISLNNTWLNSGNPVAGTGEITTLSLTDQWTIAVGDAATQDITLNFGGRGSFTYTPPTGFLSLSSENLADPIILKSHDCFETKLYMGNGTSQNITSLKFSPGIIWIKNRLQTDDHKFVDSIQGSAYYLEPNTTDARVNETTNITSINTDGFSLGTGANGFNDFGETFVSWCWKRAGQNGVFTRSYSGTAAVQNITLNVGWTPEFIMIKGINTGRNWIVYHKDNTTAPETDYLMLNSTAATADLNTIWNDTKPTIGNITVGTHTDINASSSWYIIYAFKGIPGFSLFSSYTGNASATGPFVYCGFRPAFVMIKSNTAATGWHIYDAARGTYNQITTNLVPNTNAIEATLSGVDFLSNGFKLRTITTDPNAAQTYLFAAFAEQPFKYANAK